jgi:quercetin dioxygenase-like cupin family protein/DNA-binding XRE family transcriptional regulator
MNTTAAVSIDVGERLRKLRDERSYSLRALARAAGMSANALSLIERGKTSPSVSTLFRLSEALRIPVTAFFREEPRQVAVVFCKADQRTRVPFPRGLWEGLGGDVFLGRVQPFLLTLETGATSGPHVMVHSGHEFIFCLRGQIEYAVEQETFLLDPGDSLLFAAHLSHRWRNAGRTVASALLVLSGGGDDFAPSTHGVSARAAESLPPVEPSDNEPIDVSVSSLLDEV